MFIVIGLAIPFAIVYYVSTPFYKARYQGWRDRSAAASLQRQPKPASDQVVLIRDEKAFIGRTCIVFKGVVDKKVTLSLYLLDLDPDVPYCLNLSKKNIHDGIWLGNNRFSLLSVSENVLTLKIQDSY